MHRTALALAGLVLFAGAATGCSSDDAADPGIEPSPSSPSTSTAPESAPPSDLATATSPASPRTGADADYCTAVDRAGMATDIAGLQPAVSDLVRTLPDSASSEAEDGLEFLRAQVMAADDLGEMGTLLGQATPEQQALVTAYGDFERTTCDLD